MDLIVRFGKGFLLQEAYSFTQLKDQISDRAKKENKKARYQRYFTSFAVTSFTSVDIRIVVFVRLNEARNKAADIKVTYS